MKPLISVCMIVKNEENNLKDHLYQLTSQFAEVILVDTGSTDRTVQIAREFKNVQVFEVPWQDDFAVARNFSISQATGDYILILDADESVPKNAHQILQDFIAVHPDSLGKVRVISDQKTDDGITQQVVSHITRFFPRHDTVRFQGAIHEQVVDQSGIRQKLAVDLTVHHSGYALSQVHMDEKSTRNLRLIDSILAKEPANGYYHYQKGKSLEALRMFADALSSYTKGMQYSSPDQPFHPELTMSYLYALKRQGDQELLWATVSETLQRYPDFPDLFFLIGTALIQFQVPALDTIQQSFDTCLILGDKPDQYPTVLGTGSYLAAYNLGALYESKGDLETARAYYMRSADDGYELAKRRVQQLH